MDSRIQLLLEDEFLDRVITPIERYMTEKMTEEKITIAKTNTYPIIKKAIDEFCTENNLEREDVIKYIKDYIEKQKKEYRLSSTVPLEDSILYMPYGKDCVIRTKWFDLMID